MNPDLARYNESTIRAWIAAKKAINVARSARLERSCLSRWVKPDDDPEGRRFTLSQVCKLLEAAGLAVVDRSVVEHAELLAWQLNGDEQCRSNS